MQFAARCVVHQAAVTLSPASCARGLSPSITITAPAIAALHCSWHPFLLDPSLPAEGVDKLASYEAKFGKARVAQILPHMAGVGAATQPPIAFKWGGKIAGTLASHRLIELAMAKGGEELQNKCVEELFKDYFEREANIGDVDTLVNAAARAGMDAGEVRTYLQSNEGAERVLKEVRAWSTKFRISGVPFFIVNNKFRLSGAQETDVLLEAIDEALNNA